MTVIAVCAAVHAATWTLDEDNKVAMIPSGETVVVTDDDIAIAAGLTNDAPITAYGNFRPQYDPSGTFVQNSKLSENNGGSTLTLGNTVFNGQYYNGGGSPNLGLTSDAEVSFNVPFNAGENWSQINVTGGPGTFYVNTNGNKYLAFCIPGNVRVICGATNALKAATSDLGTGSFYFNGQPATRYIDLNGYDQELFAMAVSASYTSGTLSVTNGTLDIKWGAGWGGTNVVVSGGTLKLDSANSFTNKQMRLVVSAGKIVLNTATHVASANIGGTELSPGLYEWADLPAEAQAHVESSGTNHGKKIS